MLQKFLPGFLIIFFILFSLWPTIYEWNSRGRMKPERYFELVHNFPTDYNLYVSKIRQGKEGSWLAKEKYTSEPHTGSLSQILYIAIGRIWDLAHGQTPYVWIAYHAMRVFFAGLFLFVLWKVVGGVFPDFVWQVISFLLIVTASTWPKFETVGGLPRFGGYMPWWSVIDSLQRITFIPHVVLGQAILLCIIWGARGAKGARGDMGNWIFLGVVGFILGIIFPPGLIFLYGVLGIVFLIDRKLQEKIIFFLLSFPSVVYYAMLFSQYPWKRLVEFDVLHPTRFSFIEYFLAVGPVLPLGVIGAIGGIREIRGKMKYFVAWVVAWLLYLVIFSKIPQQSPTRFTEMVPQVPLGILGVFLLSNLSHLGNLWKKTGITIAATVIVFGLGSMFSSWLWQRDFVDHKLRADYPLVPKGAEVMYPLRDLADAMVWLQVFTPRDAVVLSGQSTGNLIPVYSGNTVYVGHANTVDLENKLLGVEKFYTGNADVSWLQKQGISYVLFGPEEMEWTVYKVKDLRTWYPNLVEIYRNNRVLLYRVP